MWNPPNSVPLVLERRAMEEELEEVCWLDGRGCDSSGEFHTKDLYRLTPDSMRLLQCGSPDMAEMMLPEARRSRRRHPTARGPIILHLLSPSSRPAFAARLGQPSPFSRPGWTSAAAAVMRMGSLCYLPRMPM